MRVRFLRRPDVAVALGNLHELHNDLGVRKGYVSHYRGFVALCTGRDAGRVEALNNSQPLIASMLTEIWQSFYGSLRDAVLYVLRSPLLLGNQVPKTLCHPEGCHQTVRKLPDELLYQFKRQLVSCRKKVLYSTTSRAKPEKVLMSYGVHRPKSLRICIHCGYAHQQRK